MCFAICPLKLEWLDVPQNLGECQFSVQFFCITVRHSLESQFLRSCLDRSGGVRIEVKMRLDTTLIFLEHLSPERQDFVGHISLV
jgi:hypothetical protein